MNEKQEVREMIKIKRQEIDPEWKRHADQQITTSIITNYTFQGAPQIAIYVSLPDEVDTRQIISYFEQHHIAVFIPKLMDNTHWCFVRKYHDAPLKPNHLGILEPIKGDVIPVQECSHVFVPGVAFDPHGHRIGRGGGVYDRLLQGVSIPKIGLAYSFQIVPLLPHDSYDILMTEIITENEVMKIPTYDGMT